MIWNRTPYHALTQEHQPHPAPKRTHWFHATTPFQRTETHRFAPSSCLDLGAPLPPERQQPVTLADLMEPGEPPKTAHRRRRAVDRDLTYTYGSSIVCKQHNWALDVLLANGMNSSWLRQLDDIGDVKMCHLGVHEVKREDCDRYNVDLWLIYPPRITSFFPALINKGPQNNVFFFFAGIVVVEYFWLL